jgi:hypothetical protein
VCALRGIKMEDAMVEAMELWIGRSRDARAPEKEEERS